MYTLRPRVQTYAWGKVGSASAVAQLRALAGDTVDDSTPYAEYWFGTHPNGPCDIVLPATSADAAPVVLPLQSWLKSNPDAAGAAALADGSLPFLFKVLSVAKALSIQAHPNKSHAKALHAARPDVYKDPNHKPEMACAVTDFEAMCGFRALPEIAAFLRCVPELRAMVGEGPAAEFAAVVASSGDGATAKAALQALFTAVMKCGDAATHAEALGARLSAEADAAALEPPHDIALRLTKEYPGDVGVVAPYLLNTIVLKPGDAIFLAANEPHAYLSGDCVEVMACSDNVVRAGLTPKLRDVPTLCGMLSYTAGPPNVLRGDPVPVGCCSASCGAGEACTGVCVQQYTAPVPEFQLERITVAPGHAVTLPSATSACVLLVLGGAGAATVALPGTASGAGTGAGAGASPSAGAGTGAGASAGAGAGAGAGTADASGSTAVGEHEVKGGAVLLQDARACVTLHVDGGASESLQLFRVHTNASCSEASATS